LRASAQGAVQFNPEDADSLVRAAEIIASFPDPTIGETDSVAASVLSVSRK
jgi:hypothetical protein